jgi:hypothetical protein
MSRSKSVLPIVGLALVLSACRVQRTFECETNADCGAAARCETTTQFCSFADSGCSSGWRYDEYAGSGLDGECVMGGSDGGPSDGSQAPNCPSNYLVVGSLPGGYRYSSTGAMWLAAEADCEDDGAGSHLASIDSAGENTTIQSQLVPTARFWMGLTDRVNEGTYRTVTNVVQTYLPWESGEPGSEDDCITAKTGQFADEDCTDVRPYLCECDGVAAVPASY